MKRSPRNLLLAEFAVRVYTNNVDWGGLDFFLWRLLHVRPEGGFLPLDKQPQKSVRVRKH